jgi:mono/diheme cytochrome c family protein
MGRITFVLALFCAGAAAAQGVGDPEAGKALAEEYCARCHDIAPGGAFKQNPPSFAAIAAYRTPDDIVGRIWYPAMHTRMPPMSMLLMPEQVDDITAYIVSLEGTAQ